MANQVMWVFYDSLSKTQSNPIPTEDAQNCIFKMLPQQIERFFIWTTGWQAWQPLRLYLESDQKIFISSFSISKTGDETVKAIAREVLENTLTNALLKKEDTKSFSSIHLREDSAITLLKQQHPNLTRQVDGDELNWANVKKPDIDFSKLTNKANFGKRAARVELKIEVLLISPKGKTFRSRSKNISLSGSLLEDTIPFDYYDIDFDIVIMNNSTKDLQKSRVKMSAKVVGDGGLTSRIHYNNPSEAEKAMLQNLLQDYIDAQKNSTQKAG
jgi:hypothetical protein